MFSTSRILTFSDTSKPPPNLNQFIYNLFVSQENMKEQAVQLYLFIFFWHLIAQDKEL